MLDENIKALLDSTALPSNSDTNFTKVSEPETANPSEERDSIVPENATAIANETNMRDLYVHMVNSGNIFDIAASIMAA